MKVDFRRSFWRIADWFYPTECVECGKPGELICADCLSEVSKVHYPFCRKCGKPVSPEEGCLACRTGDFRFAACRSPFVYENAIASGIKALKYKRNLALARFFAEKLTKVYRLERWRADMIVSVPISKQRFTERGYNQSDWIARELSDQIGVPFILGALQKVVNTLPQVGLSREERKINLHDAFRAEPYYSKGKQVLLVDDVMTTGSTFNECSRVLLAAGCTQVYCLSVATALTGNLLSS